MMMGSQGLFQASEAMQSKRSDIDALDLLSPLSSITWLGVILSKFEIGCTESADKA